MASHILLHFLCDQRPISLVKRLINIRNLPLFYFRLHKFDGQPRLVLQHFPLIRISIPVRTLSLLYNSPLQRKRSQIPSSPSGRESCIGCI